MLLPRIHLILFFLSCLLIIILKLFVLNYNVLFLICYSQLCQGSKVNKQMIFKDQIVHVRKELKLESQSFRGTTLETLHFPVLYMHLYNINIYFFIYVALFANNWMFKVDGNLDKKLCVCIIRRITIADTLTSLNVVFNYSQSLL